MSRKLAPDREQTGKDNVAPGSSAVPVPRGELWISWHHSRRSETLSHALGVPLVAFQLEGPAVLRHGLSALWTFFQIARWRPRLIFTQHSFLLTLILALYSRAWPWPVKLIVDSHTKALKRDLRGMPGSLLRALRAFSFAQAEALVVANPRLQGFAQNLCPRVVVLPDPLPDPTSFLPGVPPRVHARPYIVFPASGDVDEPWEQFLVAAARVEGVDFVVTGLARDTAHAADACGHVRFVGWLPEDEYWPLLHEATAVLALTRLEDCSQCAAVEALACGVPVIATSTPALISELGDAALYVGVDLEGLPLAVYELIEHQSLLRQRARLWKQRRRGEQKSSVEALRRLAEVPDGLG